MARTRPPWRSASSAMRTSTRSVRESMKSAALKSMRTDSPGRLARPRMRVDSARSYRPGLHRHEPDTLTKLCGTADPRSWFSKAATTPSLSVV
jgi:hypothetical protein